MMKKRDAATTTEAKTDDKSGDKTAERSFTLDTDPLKYFHS